MSYQNVVEIITETDSNRTGDLYGSTAYFFYSGVHLEMGERKAYKTLSEIGAFVGKDGR